MKLKGTDCNWIIAITAVLLVTDAGCSERVQRSFLRTTRAVNPIKALRNWWNGNNAKRLVPLNQYPLWKVHKYNGISLNPVAVVDSTSAGAGGPLPDKSGSPPPVVKVPHATYSPPDEIEPPRTPYDPPSYAAPEPYEPRQPVYTPPQPTYGPPNTYGPPTDYGSPEPVYQAPLPSYSAPDTYGPPNNQIGAGLTSNNIGNSQQFNTDISSETDTSAALNALDSLGPLTNLLPDSDDESSGGLDLGTLAKIATSLPDGTVEKLVALLDLYNAKNNQQRLHALSDAASATIKFKVGAANTAAHLVEDVLLGNNGDKSQIATESGTYSNVPSDYPGRPGLLPMIPPLSGTSRNIPLPSLPEPPSLPELPLLRGLKDLINPPKLPHIYLPSTYTLPNHNVKGSYVSIRLPKPVTTYNVPNTPSPTYETPAPSYETPTTTEKPTDLYKLPYAEPISFNEVQTYLPPSTPAPIYGAPVSTSYSVSQGDSNSFQPSSATGYGVGEVQVVQNYGPPQGGFDHNKYSAQSRSSPLTDYHASSDIVAASSEHKDKVSRSAQELKTGYSRVVLQNRPAEDNNHSEVIQQRNNSADLRMYLDRNHPASTQQMHEENNKEEELEEEMST